MAGIANGIMIEGGAVYAYDPVFKPIHHDDHFHPSTQQFQTETTADGP
jgi:hypothetical protein